MFLVWD